MTWYEKIKTYLEENRQLFILIACFVLVFISGFATGRVIPQDTGNVSSSQQNYNTKEPRVLEAKTAAETKKTPEAGEAKEDNKDCPVKGNISAKGARTYHVVGGAFYDKTNPEQCFSSEEEAITAGFKRSSR
jgi:hypothetical protein